MNENQKKNKFYWIYLFFRIATGIIFIVASLEKIKNPEAFSAVIATYQILPEVLVNPLAYTLPWVEFITGMFLVFGWFVKGGALIFNLMMATFIVVFLYNKMRGLDVSCGCFSLETKPAENPLLYIARDSVFLFGGLWVLFYKFRMEKS